MEESILLSGGVFNYNNRLLLVIRLNLTADKKHRPDNVVLTCSLYQTGSVFNKPVVKPKRICIFFRQLNHTRNSQSATVPEQTRLVRTNQREERHPQRPAAPLNCSWCHSLIGGPPRPLACGHSPF